jgi:hypothetical protein
MCDAHRDYRQILDYAEQNKIDLSNSFMVWSLDDSHVLLCGKNQQRGFDSEMEAYDWARRHVGSKKLFITGPDARCSVLDENDRIAAEGHLP